MATREIELTPDLDRFVAQKIASGRYQDVSEIVREALQFQKEDDAKLEALELALEKGEASGIAEGDVFQQILDEMDSGAIDHPDQILS